MQNQRPGERVERATTVYEMTRMVEERLYDIDAELDADVFEKVGVSERAQEHLQQAQQSIRSLRDLMQNLHMRPSEDSSGGVLDADDISETKKI